MVFGAEDKVREKKQHSKTARRERNASSSNMQYKEETAKRKLVTLRS